MSDFIIATTEFVELLRRKIDRMTRRTIPWSYRARYKREWKRWFA